MPNGDQCNAEGKAIIDNANQAKKDADEAASDAAAALNKAQSTTINFGDFTFSALTPNECGEFFNSAVYTNAASAVSAAQNVVNTKNAEATAAADAVTAAEAQAAEMVKTC